MFALLPILDGKHSVFIISMMLLVSFCRQPSSTWSIKLRVLFRFIFLMNVSWNFSDSYPLRWSYILLFYSINIILYIDWFQNVDTTFHFWGKPQHHQDLLPFLYSCIWFSNILEDFYVTEFAHIFVHERYWSEIFFPCSDMTSNKAMLAL